MAKAVKEKAPRKKELEELSKQLYEGWKVGAVKSSTMKIKVTTLTPMLGTAPNDPEIYASYIAKGVDPDIVAKEIELLKNEEKYVDSEEKREKGITVFRRNDYGDPVLPAYMVKGFFKNAAHALKQVDGTISSSSKIGGAYKTLIDNLIFPYPNFIVLEGFNKDTDITYLERPLRASGPKGEIVALSKSEMIPAGVTFKMGIEVLNDDMLELVPELLDYGRYNGIGQWHNGTYGQFVWELFDKDNNVIGGNKAEYDAKVQEMDEFLYA